MNRLITRLLFTGTLLLGSYLSQAQTNSVEFGQNRIQHKNFKWRYYQTSHFNTYFSQNGLELGKYVAQVAEKELPQLEQFMEFTFRQKVNIVVYNSFGEMKQSNIGIGIDWQNTGGVTKLVGNKLLVYFDGDHEHLRQQIRQGIARVMLESLIFGEDIGEFAGNAVLIDFPKWFTDGFIAYAAENWNATLDDELKDALQSGRYTSFNFLAYEKPLLAGHAFWYYIESKYGKDAVPYLMYISRINRGLKKGFEQVLSQKPKNTLKDFMVYNTKRYQDDNRKRKQVTRGRTVVAREIKKSNFYRFQANPKGNNYAVVEFTKGVYRVQIQVADNKPKVLLRSGVRMQESQLDPNYPLLAWNQKGNRLAIIYEHEGKTKLMIYDLISKTTLRQDLNKFDRVIDMKYFFEFDNSLLLSAVRNGHTDIYTYSITNNKVDQITNDVYDDLDPSFVAFPGKSGIIYSSNRPSPTAKGSDTVLPGGHYNVFLIDNWNKSADKQVSQLTDMKYGDARSPLQYNNSHFTFVSDVNGIRNRYAGFFKTERAGVDSLFFVGSEILHNPEKTELDSALADYGATEPDSVMAVSITKDSTYTFPLTNYQYGIKESRGAGDQSEVSQVIQQFGFKRLFKLKVDTVALRKRNVNSRPTTFRAREMHEDSIRLGLPTYHSKPKADTAKKADFFQSEFGSEPVDSTSNAAGTATQIPLFQPVLKSAKLLPYKLKFSSDYLVLQLDNSVLINRYQPFTGRPTSPIQLSDPLNGMIRIGISDLMEDYKFTGGFRVPSSLDGTEYFFSFSYLKRRFDYKFTYYRKANKNSYLGTDENGNVLFSLPTKLRTNLYQLDVRYPFDEARSLRLQVGLRNDKYIFSSVEETTLKAPDFHDTYALLRLEYVYDNTINPAVNIWHGTRYKIYGDMNSQIDGNMNELLGTSAAKGKFTYNMGIDIRHYESIFRNFIWATRFSADLSWGTQKLIYYLGGVDNWLNPKINTNTPINLNESYAFQTLSTPLRGYKQNAKNGNNVMVLNTELRLPVFATFMDRPINSSIIRNFQLTSFIDIGTAWNQKLSFKDANYSYYTGSDGTVTVKIKEGFLGPFVGGYGFGARTTLAGYFMRVDAGWPAVGFFRGKPIWYFGMGVDF
ncbi:hypothetical protein SAMN05518672_1011452 [Chitinophaga sp. CF118]|uniref:hypothetical protein n=1 Tax=Chitinophaga sp. CF118 TaxID=1884367 RepID=UPI0008F232AF|nr:hypothetical protein [Chitinophaga sp. CF118]SFD28699.1 hypothetical protein SAMN05518672_1011452 [Chitinophaga sp. CF118]